MQLSSYENVSQVAWKFFAVQRVFPCHLQHVTLNEKNLYNDLNKSLRTTYIVLGELSDFYDFFLGFQDALIYLVKDTIKAYFYYTLLQTMTLSRLFYLF